MIYQFLKTDPDYCLFFLRLVAGVIIFPYGMQKLLCWFDDFGGGVGIKASLAHFRKKKIPKIFACMVIICQSIGSVALITGFLGRMFAAGNLIVFAGALIIHLPGGWVMNWTGKKSGEGIEYFVMLLSLLLIIMINGSGAISIDLRLLQKVT